MIILKAYPKAFQLLPSPDGIIQATSHQCSLLVTFPLLTHIIADLDEWNENEKALV